MTKHVCKISHLNSKRLLRKLQKNLGGYFILPHPVYTIDRILTLNMIYQQQTEFNQPLWVAYAFEGCL